MPHKLFEFLLLYDDQEVSAASPWSWHEAPTRLLDYPGAEQDQGFFDFCGLPCLSQWLGHDNPTDAPDVFNITNPLIDSETKARGSPALEEGTR